MTYLKLVVLSCGVLPFWGCTATGDAESLQTRQAIAGPAPKAIVYYMHRTYRCPTCVSMEKMIRDSLDHAFAPELADGTVQWRSVDFKDHEDLAKRLGVRPPCVVVSSPRSGRGDSYQPLDELWMLKDDQPAFNAFLTKSVRGAVEK